LAPLTIRAGYRNKNKAAARDSTGGRWVVGESLRGAKEHQKNDDTEGHAEQPKKNGHD
jgi:hypothetical protein